MEGFIILLVLGLATVVFVLPIAAFVRSGRVSREAQELSARLAELRLDLTRLKEMLERPGDSLKAPVEGQVSQRAAGAEVSGPSAATLPVEAGGPGPAPGPVAAAAPLAAAPEWRPIPPHARMSPPHSPAEPPPLPPLLPLPSREPLFDLEKLKGSLNWEQFMGAKLFAWIGGLALFLGVAYFVKYSFEHNLIPPEVRVALGFLVGIGLVAGGTMMRGKHYAITAHTLCATGILILYAVTFACRAVYHFPFFGAVPTFLLMSLVTVTAFLLAVRLEAEVVAMLGMLGGFLTPVLLSTGEDAPVALFGYIALLDAGLLAAALHRRWLYLAALAAGGTVLMQLGWASRFFEAEQYFLGNKVLIPMTVLLLFDGLWLGATCLARRRARDDWFVSLSAAGLAAVGFGFTFYFLHFESLGVRPWLLFGFAFVLDGGVLLLTRLDRRLAAAQPLAGGVLFVLLAIWLGTRASNELLPAALVFTLVFAAFHSILPLALQRRDGEPARQWSLFFPSLALLALLLPIFKLTELTVWIWPAILLVDLLAVAMAALAGSVVTVLAVLVLTLFAAGGVLFKIPSELTGLPTLLLVLGGCAVFFTAAGAWLGRRLAQRTGSTALSGPDDALVAQVPSFAVVLPFALLVMMVGRLQLLNPAPVFGLALLLVALLFGVSWKLNIEWLPLIGLGCVAALEHAWHLRLFSPEVAVPVLIWYLAFQAVFSVVPFLVRGWIKLKGPWFAAALAGPAQFFLVHQLVKEAWPNEVMGLLPAAFAVPAFLGLAAVLRLAPADSPARMTQVALFGGGALFFVTLIFPIQFERQWITIAWALEGAALCWLYHRVAHPGLRLSGVGLLVIAFVRLALNPAVLSYHPHSAVRILNWYFYTYGLAVVSLFAAARLLAPPRDRVLNVRAPALLCTLATILAFLLVNIEIADFFAEPGTAALTFQFTGDFTRDMSYSIAWALFALGLLISGLVKGIAPARYAALALLGVTLLKLFFHDLAKLAQLYRVGALVGVAVIAIVASFLYQRFTSMVIAPDENPSRPPRSP
jgi:uncharacterized membrane protein